MANGSLVCLVDIVNIRSYFALDVFTLQNALQGPTNLMLSLVMSTLVQDVLTSTTPAHQAQSRSTSVSVVRDLGP